MGSKKSKKRRRMLKYIGIGGLAVAATAAIVLTGGAAAGPIVGAGGAAAQGQLKPKAPAEPSFLEGVTSTISDVTNIATAGQKLIGVAQRTAAVTQGGADDGGGALIQPEPLIYRIPLAGPLLKAIFRGG